ncbi:MAG: agmatinase [Chloroflexi bacterium]|nr:agmatinase [Chloroflexota bacterium]MCL5076401.1 agmatinase [Chloroflexota bacterium]
MPYDSTISNTPGTRAGPQAIIDASQDLEHYDSDLGREIGQVGIHTLPELKPLMGGPRQMIERIEQVVTELAEQDKMVAMLGGEHTITIGAVAALSRRYQPLSVLQLDAHADLRDEYLGSRYTHASVMRRVLAHCPIVQVGLRSLSKEEAAFLAAGRAKPLFMEEIHQAADWISKVVSSLGENVYVTIDLDVLDPSIMPAVGLSEPDGLTWRQVLALLQAVAQNRKVVGFDVVELCPSQGPKSCAFLAAKLIYKFIGYTQTVVLSS